MALKKSQPSLKSNGHLERQYARFNECYFSNELPKDVLVGWDETLHPKFWGLTYAWANEDGSPVMFGIALNPKLKEVKEYKDIVLIHEMSHVKLFPNNTHNKKFQEEMVRLAIAGAFSKVW